MTEFFLPKFAKILAKYYAYILRMNNQPIFIPKLVIYPQKELHYRLHNTNWKELWSRLKEFTDCGIQRSGHADQNARLFCCFFRLAVTL